MGVPHLPHLGLSAARAEAAGNPRLVQRFDQTDANKDGRLSRAEYLKVMAAQADLVEIVYTLKQVLCVKG